MSQTDGLIKDFALGIFDGPHATPAPADNGPIFLGIKNVTPDGRLDLSEIRHVSPQQFAQWIRRVAPQEDDIVFSYEATLHLYARVPRGFEGCLGRRMALVRPDTTKVDPRFLLYYFLSPVWRAKMDAITITGATVNRIPLTAFPETRVSFPSLPQQKAIAEVLSAYDDLTENNRKRIALLEEAARLLYREWFVYLRFPGHEHVKVVHGVPEGWARKSLREVAECRLGKMLDQNKNKGELMPYLANVNVRWGAIDLDNLREMRFEDTELDAVGLKYGDIVMCEGGEPGRCALWKEQVPRMVIQKAIHRIRARPEVNYLFLYYCLRHQGQSGQLAPLFTGATIKHLPLEKLSLVQLSMPPTPLMSLFAEQVDAIEKQITVLEGANRRATQARDLLLPRLMSGEIAI